MGTRYQNVVSLPLANTPQSILMCSAACIMYGSFVCRHLFYHLTPEVRGDVGDMNPAAVALPDQLRETYLPLLLHLLDELEQAAVVGTVAGNDIGSTPEEVVAVLGTTHQLVELLAAIATAHHDGFAPRLADGIKELLY